ncbi:MAG: ribosome maturation factor RimM, partial [Bacteroidales bacterium]
INIGFTTKPHGIDGTIVMKIEGDFEENLLKREFLFLSIDETLIPFFVDEFRISGDSAFIKFEGYNSEDDIKKLKARKVYIESELSEKEPDLKMLVGYSFKDKSSGREGNILDFEEYNENLVFKVESDEKEYLLPLNPDFILSIDPEKKCIFMNLPEGIFNLDD